MSYFLYLAHQLAHVLPAYPCTERAAQSRSSHLRGDKAIFWLRKKTNFKAEKEPIG